MQEPAYYGLKKWLCSNIISGLKIHYYQTGTDTADTDWELFPLEGKPKRVKAHTVSGLVDIRPDWNSILRAKESVCTEVKEWDKFAKKEARDLAEFKRLSEKFKK